MQTPAIIIWVYAALILVGGVMGWAKARSQMSLWSGLIFGVALILVGVGVARGYANHLIAATVLAGLLAIIMGVRFVKTKKFMPAGLVAILSVVVVALLLRFR
jgi:uncharacterized membrane protein (UPF0136 family)